MIPATRILKGTLIVLVFGAFAFLGARFMIRH
jgi:hypothetical protein